MSSWQLTVYHDSSYSGVPDKQVCSHQKKFGHFPFCSPLLLRKNEQGRHSYLVPCSCIRACSFIRNTRVGILVLVWWRLWNILMVQVKFSIFLDLNDHPKRNFCFLIRQGKLYWLMLSCQKFITILQNKFAQKWDVFR